MTREKNASEISATGRRGLRHPLRHATTVTIIVLAALVSAACERGTVGIFASIEREEKTIQSNLPKDQTVSGFAETTEAYFVAIGPTIYTRSIAVAADDEEPWTALARPVGEYVASGVASAGDIVAASYVREAGSRIVVFGSAAPSTELGKAERTGQIVTLFAAGGEVFVVERSSNGDHLFHHLNLTDPASPSIVPLALPGAQPRIRGVAFGGGAYWFVTSDTVLRSLDANTAPVAVPAAPGITNIGGITVTAGGTVVVSSNFTGRVAYSTDDGATWDESGTAGDTRFPSIAAIGDTAYLGARRGVYTLPVSGLDGTPAVIVGQGYESSALRNASVLGGFFAASNDDGIFILTNKGLWRREVQDGSLSWIWE